MEQTSRTRKFLFLQLNRYTKFIEIITVAAKEQAKGSARKVSSCCLQQRNANLK